MSNAGLLPGLNQDGWRRYEPLLACAGAGGETQPSGVSSGSGSNPPFGRYLITDHASILVEAQFAFDPSLTYNVGAGSVYVVSLPFPANRWTGKGVSSPVPLGLGMCYFSGTAPNVNVPVTITLADPFASLAGTEDGYVQAYCQTILSWGTGTFTQGAGSTVTVTHRLGYTPRAEDVSVVFTSQTTATTNYQVSIQNRTSTTFDAVIFAANGSPTFSWKIRGKPPTGSTGALMSPTTPWDWTRTNPSVGDIFFQFEYEPKR